ncbi:hypothetical protein [Caulobacter soli]|uniref:hypothetical protein n=1 Tax=Caulobacter soli TaxID=2708539 RepID=UPI0013EAB492|nr:hypothetical protein [Caulobacter soli]
MTIGATNSTSGLAQTTATTAPRPDAGFLVSELKRIDISTIKPLAARLPPVARLPSLIDPRNMIDAMRNSGVTSDDDPSKLFAEVYKDGKVVARLYNGGSSTTYGQADGIVTGTDEPYAGGPQLAQWRANKIAAALGGTVKMADTAQTQSQWEITYAADQAKRDQAMAPYRAAMDAFRAQWDPTTAQVSTSA